MAMGMEGVEDSLGLVPRPAPAILVEDVSKSFRHPTERVHTLKERALHPFRRSEHKTFDALHDVGFEVAKGEFFGIVGRNGSGKSTLLKCLAGIYAADSGRMLVDGRVATFIELGVGFNPDLAARDNAMLNAIMLGLTKPEAAERVDRIIEFAGLTEFEELKLKNYSSGMLVRLAFSVMIQVDADVLLIDEVLAVGDAEFQQKCFDEFNRLRDEGRTVLLVTHDMPSVQRFCDRAMLLERGRVVMLDEAEQVAARYYDVNFGKPQPEPPSPREDDDAAEEREPERRGDGSAEIVDGWFENRDGQPVATLAQGEPCSLCARVRFDVDIDDPFFGATFVDGEHHNVFAAATAWHMKGTGSFRKGEVATLRISFENWFAPGRYYVAISIARDVTGQDILDHRPRVASVIVSGTRPGGGLVDLPHELVIERGELAAEAGPEALEQTRGG
jgi:ABC-type polysaccharide/polyol phosphate transport system ATPase subunit